MSRTWLGRLGAAGIAALVAASFSTPALALAGTGGRQGCTLQQEPWSPPDLSAGVNAGYAINLDPGTLAFTADSVFDGYLQLGAGINNGSDRSVTNPNITLDSGYDPALFGNSIPTPSFPSTCGIASLAPRAGVLHFPYVTGRGLPSSFSLGYDLSTGYHPEIVPTGVSQQRVDIAVTIRDPRYAGSGPGGGPGIHVQIGGPSSTVVSSTDPANLDQGEHMLRFGQSGWGLNNVVLGKRYAFSAVLQVTNNTGNPWTFRPGGFVFASEPGTFFSLSGPSVTIPAPLFDGPTPGRGSVTFRVDETNHTWAASRATNFVTTLPQGLFPDINATYGPDENGGQPATVDSTLSSDTFAGFRSWFFTLKANRSVTAPTIKVTTAYPSSVLSTFPPGVAGTTSPIVFTQPSGQAFQGALNAFSVPVTFRPGYDSTRSVSPVIVPVGGGVQTVTATVRPVDPAVYDFNILFFDNVPGVTTLSMSGPSNLDQGERLFTGSCCGAFANWGIGNAVTGKAYTLSVTIQVPNPFGVPFAHKPSIHLFGHVHLPGGCAGCGGPAQIIAVNEPTLDDGTPGSGTVTFSVQDGGLTWWLQRDERRVIRYQSTLRSQLVGLGPAALSTDAEVVSARLQDPGGVRIAGAEVHFSAGSASCNGITAADGVASCTLSPALEPGQHALSATFAGNESFYPAKASAPLLVYQPTQFVIWGGNPGGVTSGSDYTFWGAHWWDQVTGGDFEANASFKGYADSVGGGTWRASPGASSQAPASVASYIGVLVATSAHKDGKTESGAVGGVAVLRVDGPAAYAPDPGHPGSGVLVATVR